MRPRVRQVTIDGRPMIGLITDGGFMLALDRSDTLQLIADLQREVMANLPAAPDTGIDEN